MAEQPAEWRGVTWQPEIDELERAIAHGLCWAGRRRAREAHHIINTLAAEKIFAHLQADGFVFMHHTPRPFHNGWAGTGPFARLEHIRHRRNVAHCRSCGHRGALDVEDLIARGRAEMLLSKLPLVCTRCGSRDAGLAEQHQSRRGDSGRN